jgi:prepilin-type processing-associated H-X9-DG protein
MGNSGFSRSDLLALVLTIALVFGLFLSLGAGTRQTSELVMCRANLRHQGQAWQSYALDHSGQVIGSGLNSVDGENWAVGRVSWSPASSERSPENVQVPAYVPYIGTNPRVFRCPSDRYLSSPQVKFGWSFRVRSYSMNAYFGPQGQGIGLLRQFERLTDVPQPDGYFVLVEEHPDSINDPSFFTTFGSPSGWVDLPAAFHERSANFLFADSHVETHEWQSDRTVIPVRFRFPVPAPAPKDPDFRWAFERTSLNGR